MNFNNNIKNLHSRKITDFNINNEIKNSINVGKNFNKILNNDNYKKIKYTPIYANEPINYNLCNSYDNDLKVYKSKIKKEDNDYNNNDIRNNKDYYLKSENNNNNNLKDEKILLYKPRKNNTINN